MKVTNSSIIYENPLPQLRSRHAFFPFLCELPNGVIAATFAIGEAFESIDSSSYIAFSYDGGKSWGQPKLMFETIDETCPITDYCKVSVLDDGRLIAFGYAYLRANPELPLGNPENGGVLDDYVFYSLSEDNGNTWSKMVKIPCVWGPHVEASAPITILQNGAWISPITGFPDWNGNMTDKMCGRVLYSTDKGDTWNDNSICMDFGDNPITCYEQRICQLDSGAVICIGWNENVATGERLPNHYTVSYDNGKTWTTPKSTGIGGQASSVCAIGGEKLLSLHAVRRDTDKPGIYGYIVDFTDRKWNIIDSAIIWEPKTPLTKNDNMAEIFSFLKFGQPGAIFLKNGNILMSHWFSEDGQYKTIATEIEL